MVAGEETHITRDEILSELRGIASEARRDKDYTPAINALKLLGAELGMFNGGLANLADDLARSESDIRSEVVAYMAKTNGKP